MKKLQSSIGCLILLVSVAAAFGCFITNCPPGGKRSGPPQISPARQCESCGAEGGGGRCFGPNICCLPEFGCLIGTPETFVCSSESRFPTPCKNLGALCSGNGNIKGQCAGEGICCSSETCTLDENCRELTSTTMIGDGDSPDTPISFQEDQGPRPPEVNRVRPQNLFPREQIIGRRLSARLYEQLLNHQHQSLDEPRPIPTPPEVKRSFQ